MTTGRGQKLLNKCEDVSIPASLGSVKGDGFRSFEAESCVVTATHWKHLWFEAHLEHLSIQEMMMLICIRKLNTVRDSQDDN